MAGRFSDFERNLLWLLQSEFPLAERPFALVAEQVGRSEQDVLGGIAVLKDSGVVRQIGAIFDAARLGYTSALVAARVEPARLDAVARGVSAHKGVSHNYSRDHAFNLWFTLAAPPGENLVETARILTAHSGVVQVLILPTVRTFKIDARFGAEGQADARAAETRAPSSTNAVLVPEDIPFVRALQEDLPLECRPFRVLAEAWNLDENAVLDAAQRFLRSGIMRRYGATLRHQQAGYVANAMACWELEPDRVEAAGRAAADHPTVSHCYERPAHPPEWPYNLFTMVHARSDDQLARAVADLHERIRPRRFAVLRTVREYKKARVRYFDG